MNACIILMQAVHLYRTKKSDGVSIKMFAFFIAFQTIFAFNGWRLGDPLQMWGMVASVFSTSTVITLAVHYRRAPA